MRQNTPNELLSLEQARILLGVSRATMYRIVRTYGELSIAKIAMRGSQEKPYFNHSDVLALKERRNPSR